jgi:hypothetical protein
MTDVEHTLLALLFLGAAYIWGRAIGVKAGIIATVEYFEEQGILKFIKEDDEDE